MTGLPFGPIDSTAVHVVVDMQVYFSRDSEWAGPATAGLVPNISRLAAHRPERTIFTRFLTPMRVSDAEGQWQTYYRRWKSVLAENNDQVVFDLIAPLGDFVPPGRIVDKYTYSAFGTPVFAQILGELGARTLVMSGVETDVCVMATALTAVDLGYRVVIAADAVASSSPAGHDAALQSIYPRYDHQIEISDTETLIREWKS